MEAVAEGVETFVRCMAPTFKFSPDQKKRRYRTVNAGPTA